MCATRMCVRRACDAHAAYTRASMHARTHAQSHICMWCACSSVRTCCPRRGRSPSLQAARSACAARRQAGRPAHKAQSPLKSRPGVAARGGSCDWATAWGYGPAQTVMSIGMRYFDLTGRNTQGRQSISACARGRCARAAVRGAGIGHLSWQGMSEEGVFSQITGTRSLYRSRTRADSATRCSKECSRLCAKLIRIVLLDGPNGAPAKALSGVSSMGGGGT